MSKYAFGYEFHAERDRLQLLEQYTDPLSIAALERIGVRPGWSCADLGAGGGSIADWLARRVGPTGQVFAVDTDTRLLVSGDSLLVSRQDALDFAQKHTDLDLVHIRFLLVHLSASKRDLLLSQMRSTLRPGGAVCVVESDYSSWAQRTLGDPMLDHVRNTYLATVKDIGWDLGLGVSMAGLLEGHGFSRVQAEGRVHFEPAGSPMCKLVAESVTSIAQRHVGMDVLTDEDLAYFTNQLMTRASGFHFVTTWATWGYLPI